MIEIYPHFKAYPVDSDLNHEDLDSDSDSNPDDLDSDSDLVDSGLELDSDLVDSTTSLLFSAFQYVNYYLYWYTAAKEGQIFSRWGLDLNMGPIGL